MTEHIAVYDSESGKFLIVARDQPWDAHWYVRSHDVSNQDVYLLVDALNAQDK